MGMVDFLNIKVCSLDIEQFEINAGKNHTSSPKWRCVLSPIVFTAKTFDEK
jgi:hypothetical protein